MNVPASAIDDAREEWLARALSDRATDRSTAASALAALYEGASLPPPFVMWTPSPVPGATESQRLVDASRSDPAARRLVGAPVLDRVLESARSLVRRSLDGQLKHWYLEALDAQIGRWVETRLGPLRAMVMATAMDTLGRPRRRREVAPGQLPLELETWHQPSLCGYGYLDAPWLAVADIARQQGASYESATATTLDALIELTQIGCWWPYERIVVASERPSTIRLDEQFRPHCEDGPAIAYADWEVFSWHGSVVTPEGLDLGRPLTVERVLVEADPDLQRLLVNRYGVERFRVDAKAIPVDHDRYGTLWRFRLPSGDRLQMVEVINSTPEPDGTCRRYNIRVPPDIRSPIEAVAWTFGLTARGYRARLRAQT